jgi:hypothetical protein
MKLLDKHLLKYSELLLKYYGGLIMNSTEKDRLALKMSPVQYSLGALLWQMVSLALRNVDEHDYAMLHVVFHFGFTFYSKNTPEVTITPRVHFLLKEKELSPHVFLAVDSNNNNLTSDIEFKYYSTVERAEEAIYFFASQTIEAEYERITGKKYSDGSGTLDISSWVITDEIISCKVVDEEIDFPTSNGKKKFFFVQKSMFEVDLLVSEKLFKNMDLAKEKK